MGAVTRPVWTQSQIPHINRAITVKNQATRMAFRER